MLKGTLAALLALVFLRLLSSVTGDEGFPGNNFPYDSLPVFMSTLKEMCLVRLDPLSCQYWDSLGLIESPIGYRTEQVVEIIPENGTSGKEIPEGSSQEISIEVPDLDAENNLHKRFSVFRRKTPTARGYKRGPGFRSWGGKRDLIPSAQIFEKKSKFASWGGKRDEEVFSDDLVISDSEDFPEKRQKFQNWGGKKSTNDFVGNPGESVIPYKQMEKRAPIWKDRGLFLSEVPSFKKHVPKRPQFQSWGGKRAAYPWHNFLEFLQSRPRYLLNGGEKRKFSSWGGKRFDESETQHDTQWEEKARGNIKRQGFRNWGGKRGTSDNDLNEFTLKESGAREDGEERRKREASSNDQIKGPSFNLNSWGKEVRGDKNRR